MGKGWIAVKLDQKGLGKGPHRDVLKVRPGDVTAITGADGDGPAPDTKYLERMAAAAAAGEAAKNWYVFMSVCLSVCLPDALLKHF